MASSLESKRSSKQQQNSNVVKERFPVSQAHHSSKYQGKLRAKDFGSATNCNLPYGRRQDADNGVLIQPKTYGDCQQLCIKGKVSKDDELVRYMSNLPGYLQHLEREENLHGNAFNVGVLDWARLENWKQNGRSAPGRGGNNGPIGGISFSKMPTKSSSSSTVPGDTLGNRIGRQSLSCSTLNSSRKVHLSQGAHTSVQKVKQLRDFETASKGTLDRQKKTPCNYKSSGRNYTDIVIEKGKKTDRNQKITSGMGNLSSNMTNCEVSLSLGENASSWDCETGRRTQELQGSDVKKKAIDWRITSDVGTSSLKLRNYGTSISFRGTLSPGNDDSRKGEEKFQESEMDLAYQHLAGEHKNIVLLLPRKYARNIQKTETQASLDEKFTEAERNSFSHDFSHKEFRAREVCADIPHSCPLPFRDEINYRTDMMHQDIDGSSDASKTSTCLDKIENVLSENNCAEISNIEVNADAIESTKALDQETAEVTPRKSRHPSPNRRFSFSFSRMSRSFSFKEGSAIPQLSRTYVSVKSGPVRSEGSASLDDSHREKANAHNRARSSPLRRILDPLLKSKGLSSNRSADTVLPSKGGLTSFDLRSVTTDELLQSGKQDGSRIRALLQLSIRNGLPLFQFVVDNNRNILAATKKNLLSSGKDDSGQNFTFYSVSEVKKKSGGWISQGNKEKHCGFVYNVVGQMKLYSSHISDLTGHNSDNEYIVGESVLFGIDLRPADQASPKPMPSRELAAIVVKIRNKSLSNDAQKSDKSMSQFPECFPEDRHFCSSEENEDTSNTTVILPGGVHSLPHNGVPSPLIQRWKSGGSCDCGGWDVGCKLRILSSQNQCDSISKTSKVHLNSNSFELFVQGGAQQSMPIFNLVPLKGGIYSVDFNSSISLLQAFFICVTIVSCQKSPDLSDVDILSEAKVLQETTPNGNNQMKRAPTSFAGEGPAKYAPNPPLSPVGRV